MIIKRNKNFEIFLNQLPQWCFKEFNLDGQSNYAFNLILKEKDNSLIKSLREKLDQNGIEFRQGSAGGGNQLRQPYIREKIGLTIEDLETNFPNVEHIHFFGMYLGNYPELQLSDIDWLLKVLKNV